MFDFNSLLLKNRSVVRVTVDKREIYSFDTPISVGKILKRLNFLPFEVLVIKGNRLLTRDVVLRDNEEIEIKTVYSKG